MHGYNSQEISNNWTVKIKTGEEKSEKKKMGKNQTTLK